jgi:MFS family permease
LGSTIYSFIYFSRAIAANIGIVASSFILPNFGWFGCFVFFGVLTIISFILLLVFNEKPIPDKLVIENSMRINNSYSSFPTTNGGGGEGAMAESPVLGERKIPRVEDKQEEWDIAGGTGKNTERSKPS